MSEIPKDLLYTEEHEYVKPTDDPSVVAIGVTDYAQGELGDIVFIELPKVGATFGKHDVFGTVEAVKAVSELYSPLAGEVIAVKVAGILAEAGSARCLSEQRLIPGEVGA